MRRSVPVATALLLMVGLGGVVQPAVADHTDPRDQLAPTEGQVTEGLTRGAGEWEHLANFPGLANPALTGGGTDLEFFRTGNKRRIFGSFGTLGQDRGRQRRASGSSGW